MQEHAVDTGMSQHSIFKGEKQMLHPRTTLMGKINNNRGFTLLEVMISAVILAVGIHAVAVMQTSAINGNNTSRSHGEATTLAQNWIETIVRVPWQTTAVDLQGEPNWFPVVDVTTNGVGGLNDGVRSGNNADFTWVDPTGRYTFDFNYADNVAVADTQSIRIVVTWRDARGSASWVDEFGAANAFPDGVRRRTAVFDFIKSRNLDSIA